MKNIKKHIQKISISILAAIIAVIPAVPVRAEEDFSSLHPVHYFAQPNGGGMNLVDKTEEIKSDNYWVELKYSKVESMPVVAGKQVEYFKTLVPKYVLEPKETAVNEHAKISTNVNFYCAPEFISTGIIPKWSGLNIMLHPRAPKDNPYFKQFSTIPADRTNPFKFQQGDILTTEETDNPLEKLQVLADLKAKGSNDSTKIDEYYKGDSIELDFSMNASWFKRYMNGFALFLTQVGGMSDEGVQKVYNQYAMSDAQIVFTLNIPDGVTVSDTPTAKISGIDGFTATVSKEKKTLVIKLRKTERGKVHKWKELIKKINSTDTSNINVSVSGLKISNNVTTDNPISINGTVAGFYDFATSKTEKFYLPSPEHNNHEELGKGHENSASRYYWSFAAVQDPKGLDKAVPSDKSNLISYTFKVKKPANNTVTFKNGDDTYASVKVENGKAIDTDNLADQSMPANPSKAGYTFKEWNTSADGKGMKFTGTTVVNEDTTVYAIYDKNVSPMNEAPTLEVKDKTIKKGEKFDLMSLVVSAKDKEDGDLTKDVKLIDDGGFNKDKIGKYTVTFKVTDKDGASVTKKAVVTVVEKSKPALKPDNNSGKKLPKTGNDANIILYATLLGLSGAVLTAVGIRRKKEN